MGEEENRWWNRRLLQGLTDLRHGRRGAVRGAFSAQFHPRQTGGWVGCWSDTPVWVTEGFPAKSTPALTEKKRLWDLS